MNKLTQLFKTKSTDLLSIYLTAGYPNYDDTLKIAQYLDTAMVDFIELGMPFSDPLADGPTIQKTSQVAIKKGMSFEQYFKLAKEIRNTTKLPIVFMGYYNQVLKIGAKKFCEQCSASGIDAVIIPDLPLEEYQEKFIELFKEHAITISFLVTPNTSEERIKKIINLSSAFVYVVSDNSITGNTVTKNEQFAQYFQKIKTFNHTIPAIVGFGIHNKESYDFACTNLDGAIIGTAFLKAINTVTPLEGAKIFIESIKINEL